MASVMDPIQELFQAIQPRSDFAEICCSPTSSMSNAVSDLGYKTQRINYKEGYDMQSKVGQQAARDWMNSPDGLARFSWVSFPCTKFSSLQDRTFRTPQQYDNFLRSVKRDLSFVDTLVDTVMDGVEAGGDFAWEWPTGAHRGWNSKPIEKLRAKCAGLGKTLSDVKLHGCAFGLVYQGQPVFKPWRILITSQYVAQALDRRCPGHTNHIECRGPVAVASPFYPKAIVKKISEAIKETVDCQSNGSVQYHYNLCCEIDDNYNYDDYEQLYALNRTKFESHKPVWKKLDAVKSMMMRVHKAGGHQSFATLVQLLRRKGAPTWAVELAQQLRCEDCVESKAPLSATPASMMEPPKLWEITGTDVFEYRIDGVLIQMAVYIDRASKHASVSVLAEISDDENGRAHFEPNSKIIISSLLADWLQHNPTPEFLMTDAGTYYTSQEFTDYCNGAGIGLLTAPGEAHWLMGTEESLSVG